jgi:phenylalanine-4-hydroxylase
MRVLHEYASTMALRTGGIGGLRKAADSGAVATAVYSSGLQVSGIIGSYKEFIGEPAYLQFISESSLSYKDKQLEGQGKDHHAHGFGSPVGTLRGEAVLPEGMTDGQIDGYTDNEGITTLLFESGVEVKGRVITILRREGKIILIRFNDCTVTFEGDTLFQPGWGIYDMAVGAGITSVFPGPADPAAWGLKYPELKEKTHKILHTPEDLELHALYQAVRDLRDSGKTNGQLEHIWHNIRDNHPDEWLLPLEILELVSRSKHPGIRKGVRNHLAGIKKSEEFAKLVDDGLNLLNLEPRP